jgi:pimeloyl-ACP methyl ester carboxylesterase/DNA-binding CsgD family transcriptional regulator
MNVPAVQYVKTSDGMSIAYTICGEGEPVVFMPGFLGHVQNIWERSAGALLPDLAARFRLVCYDSRGQGLSTRNLSGQVCLDDFMLDLEAVLDHLDLQRFILVGSCNFSLQAAHYAIRHPERVSALVLVNGALSWDAWKLRAVYDDLPSQDWQLFLYNMVPQDCSAEDARKWVSLLRESMSQRDYLVSVPAWRNAGLEDSLDQLCTPTLVLHSKDFRLRSVEGPMELARRLRNGRLVLMDSNRLFGDPGQAIVAIEEFLGALSEEASEMKDQPFPSPRLTAREVEVLRLIAHGSTNREIADRLIVSMRTVERHITHIYAKISARGKADATAYALRHSLI